MHTNEITYDTFIPRWYGRFGNNVQQITNGIYFCEKNKIHFTSADHPYIKPIDVFFGDNDYKIKADSNNWFYHFAKPHSDFDLDIEDLNLQRRRICRQYIYPNLKVDHTLIENDPLPYDKLVIHVRSGDLYTHFPPDYAQNPLMYYLELFRLFSFNVLVIMEDRNNPFTQVFERLNVEIQTPSVEESLTLLLRAQNIATSGVSSFPIAAAFCSKNIQRLYCSNLYLDTTANPSMLKNYVEVHCMHLDGDKYMRVGEWRYSEQVFDKLFNYQENTSFRRL